ncbi:glycoside hydrolase family 75 protein [Rubritalea spongiae]|uniref:Glycoside hydrolase family 75 protein n=1 Tax=Rubritalea spongiae TaxID=430797 RepID=A0ABW5E486_9BACT
MAHSKESMLQEGDKKGFPWLRASFFLLVLFAVIVPFTAVPERLKDYVKELILAKKEADRQEYVAPEEAPVEEIVHVVVEEKEEIKPSKEKTAVSEVVEEDPIMVEKAIATKEHFVGTKGDMVRMSKGFYFDYTFETSKGALASSEREDKQSYVAEYKLKVRLPKASQSLEELSKVNSKLGDVLPGLSGMLDEAKVSDFYYTLYENKVKRLEREVVQLNELSTKHNFYDCETILNLTHKQSGRKMLLLQGDMDVVSDGSDGDRLAEMPDKIVNSTHYQPFTSYGWKKQTKTPNPMVAGWKKRIGNAKREIADPQTTAERKAWLKARMKMLQRGIDDMEARSFLIAEYDPFIVMPVNVITNRTDSHATRVGDYAVVIVDDVIYPAIVGDGGPTFKVGEASLRMAKQINEKASPYSRPVSDLTVTYLVFSNSRDLPASPPNYEKWRERCAALLGEIGGLGEGYSLYEWEDLLAPQEDDSEEVAGSQNDDATPEKTDAGNTTDVEK